MEDWFDPLDFPNGDKHIPKFHGHNVLVALYVLHLSLS